MITLNYKYTDADIIGIENGLNIQEEFERYKDKISDIVTGLYDKKNISGQGLQWLNLGYSEETAWYVKEYAALVENRFENILILGTGGSSLGGMAVCEALLKPYWNFLSSEQRNNYPRIFFLNNIDPDSISGLLDILDLKKTLVNVITKSGDTPEIMAQFMIIKDKLENELGDDYRKNIVATTDKNTGILRQIAEQEGYKTFVVPDDVGGRFSVFTAVGLLLFALVGINIDEMMAGIKDLDKIMQNPDIYTNIAAQNALIHYLMHKNKNKFITVMMPYSDRLKYLSDWFVQLWAESLGKEKDNDNNIVNTGLTPVKAVGLTDQHSQMQLFNEGPADKVVNFIRVENFDNVVTIPKIFEYTGIGYLGEKTLNHLFNAEADSTSLVLSHTYKRPSITITIPQINAYYVAQLLYMLQVQTAITGALYNIDTFNQPGVIEAQNYTYAFMGRVGYEDSANMLKAKLAETLTK